jgi:hypothetical protein
MDAFTRCRLEIEGYRELGLWDEAQEILESFCEGLAERPDILGFLSMLDVAIEFTGYSAPVAAPELVAA